MKHLRFFKSKEKEDFLVLDFGRDSIKGIIFQPKGKENIIKGYQVEKIKKFGVFQGKDFELGIVKKAASKVIENLGIKDKISEFKKILGFSPDIIKAKVFNLFFKRKKEEERINEREKNEIYKSIFKECEKKLFEKERSRDIKFFKKRILKEKISGYQVPSISGFKGSDLTFKVLVVYSPKTYFGLVESLKNDLNFQKAEIFHTVEGLVNFLKLKNKHPKMFLDIGARNTLISFFKESLEFVEQFPIGGYDFTKRISENLGLRESDAEVLKEDFSKSKLSSKIEKRVDEIILPVLNSWEKNLTDKIKDKIRLFGFSGEVYLLGGGSLLPSIKKTITENLKTEKVKFLLADNLPIKNKTKVSFSSRETSSLLLTLSKNAYEKKNY